MVRFNGSLNPHFGRKISALWRRDAAPCAEAILSKSTDSLTIPEPRYPHFQLLDFKMLYYVLHGMTTGAKFPRSELVAFVKNRATETALISPTGRLTSSRFKLSVFISANFCLSVFLIWKYQTFWYKNRLQTFVELMSDSVEHRTREHSIPSHGVIIPKWENDTFWWCRHSTSIRKGNMANLKIFITSINPR